MRWWQAAPKYTGPAKSIGSCRTDLYRQGSIFRRAGTFFLSDLKPLYSVHSSKDGEVNMLHGGYERAPIQLRSDQLLARLLLPTSSL